MRRLALIGVVILAAFLGLSFGGSFSIRCYKCRETTLKLRRGYSHCMGCAMWRKYGEEALPKNEGYMVYRCEHGHKLLIPLSSNPNTQDLNEILVENSDGTREKLKFPNGF